VDILSGRTWDGAAHPVKRRLFQYLFLLFRSRRLKLGYLVESVEFQGCPDALYQLCPAQVSLGMIASFRFEGL